MELYVGNVSFQSTEASLREAFAACGAVASIEIPTNRFNGRPRGFAFVTMADEAGGKAALEQLNGKEIDGRAITINPARGKEAREPREARPPRVEKASNAPKAPREAKPREPRTPQQDDGWNYKPRW